MDLTRQMLERLYEAKLSEDFDRIIIVLGDEGAGKSTLMLQCAWFVRDVIPELDDPTVENVTGDIAWDRGEYKEKLAEGNTYRPIVVHDATRIMSKKKAMHSEQVELEEDLFDSRYGRNVQFLGYQEWDAVPTVLQQRRAQNVFHVTSRGKFSVYGRKHMDKRMENGDWPHTSFVDTFQKLNGTRLWDSFREKDEAKKQERIAPDSEEQEMSEQELAEHIIEEDLVADVTTINQHHNETYIDSDLIQVEFDISGRKAKRVKKLVDRELQTPEP